MVKNLPPMQKTRVQSLGWEFPLEKEKTIHSHILECRIPWIEKPGRLQSLGSQRVRHDWATNIHTHIIFQCMAETQINHNPAEAEAPILWPPNMKNQLIGKDPDAGTDWKQEEKGTTDDEMVGWHHWLDRHESEQTQGDGEGQGSLACAVHGVTKSQTRLRDWATVDRFVGCVVFCWYKQC